eukprot:c30957_g1_i1.p1 GENE.c30957_g1_i1~~c30957_g1_i1.p1  ORF type:complete len:283 (-),score=47.96 c30957_g1_i1:93-941(-)
MSVIAKVVIVFWAALSFLYGLSLVSAPGPMVDSLYSNNPPRGLSYERVKFLLVVGGLVSMLIGSFGFIAVKTAYNLKSALYVYMLSSFVTTSVLVYTVNNSELLGTSKTEGTFWVVLFIVYFVVAWFVSLGLPHVENDTQDVPRVVSMFFFLSTTFLFAVSMSGLVAPKDSIDLTFINNPSETASESAQLQLDMFTVNGDCLVAAAIGIYSYFNPHRLLILWHSLVFLLTIGVTAFEIDQQVYYGYNQSLNWLYLLVPLLFLIFSGFAWIKMPNSTVYMEMK